jgi:hypothetical protein
MTTDEAPDGHGGEDPTGPAQGGGSGSADPEPGQASRVGDHESGQFDAGDFVVDHDVDPPEEVQPTTTA